MSEEVVLQQPNSKPEKVKKPKSLARKIIEWVAFGIFGILFAFILAGNIQGMIDKNKNYGQTIRFGVGSFIVLTSSMEPEIPQNSAIITYKEDVKTFESRLAKGEKIDITFANVPIGIYIEPDTEAFRNGQQIVTNQIMTHRLREVHVDETVAYGKGRYIFVAAGINTGGDYALEGQYQVFTEQQYLGTVKMSNSFLGKVFNFMTSALGLILILLIPAAYLIVVSSIDIFKALKTSEENEEAIAKGGDKLSTISAEDRERLKKELLDEMIQAKKEKKDNE